MDTGPIWLDCGGVRKPGWLHVTESGDRWTMTEMTDPDDIAFWFGIYR